MLKAFRSGLHFCTHEIQTWAFEMLTLVACFLGRAMGLLSNEKVMGHVPDKKGF